MRKLISLPHPVRVPSTLLRCLSVTVLLAAASDAGAESYQSVFDFRIAGIRAGEIEMAGIDGGDSYRAEAEVRTAGLIGVFADFFYDGTAEGRISGNGRVVPESFVASSRSPRDDRKTRIDWEAGTPVYVSVEPPRSTSPEPSAQGGTLDPVSASFALLRDGPVGEICRKSVDIFDGSRRSRITLGTPQPDGADLICNGSYERLEGEENSFNSSSAHAFRVIYRERENGAARLERIETRTNYGTAALVRQ